MIFFAGNKCKGLQFQFDLTLECTPQKMGTFIRRQLYERVGISLVEVCESVGKSVISVFKRTKKGVTICQ